jgi:hypothetical protein
MPNIYSGFGGVLGGMLGGGGGAYDPTQKKRRPLLDGGGAAPMPGGPPNPGEPNPLTRNIYQQYPGINPQYRGDQFSLKERGMGDASLERLSQGAIAYKNRHAPMRGGVGGIGYGESMVPDPLRRLLQARYGSGV